MIRRKTFRLLLSTNIVLYFVVAVILTVFIPWILSFLPLNGLILSTKEIPDLKELGAIKLFIIATLFAPIIETLFFQTFIIHLIKSILKKIRYNRFYIPILVSGLLFGLSHLYSLHYMISGVFMGLIFAFTYKVFMNRKENSFVVVAGIHSVANLIVFCIDYLK
jgi:membrane protease YdiL (CAAX protease family)